MADEVQYEFKSVRAIRGTESRSITKWEKDGWELVDQDHGKLQTTLNFRRPKASVPWALVGATAAAIVLIFAVVAGVAVALQSDDDGKEPTASPTTTTGTEIQEPSGTPEPSDTVVSTQTPTPSPTEPDEPDALEVITVDSTTDFAAALAVPTNCHQRLLRFSNEYSGRTIEFDGSIVDMANHGDYDTRYDILLAPGNKGPMSTVGPLFKYEDVNLVSDLGLTAPNVPEYIAAGDTFSFTAEVGEYNDDNCLFFLEPVETRVR